MGTRYSSGFTIIETVLFLSVTGLLVMGVLIGTGTSINNQRYRDATQTIKNTVQEQYTALESVRNGRNNNWTCQPGTALPVQGGTEIRGQSSCVIVGRYMQIKSNEITIYSVLARKNNDLPSNTDIAALNANYVYGISTSEVVSKTMEWGTEIAWPQSGSGARADTTPRNIAILFVRSPESGAVYTFTSDDVPPFNDIINPGGIKSMISTSSQGQRTICIKVDGAIGFKTGDTALYLSANAASASAIETRSNDTAVRLGGQTGTPQC